MGVWFNNNVPIMWEQIVSHEGWIKTDGGGQGGGRMRRIFERARRFKPFPLLVAFFGYFLSLKTESNRKEFQKFFNKNQNC